METIDNLPSTKAAAKLKNSVHYFTGKPCKHGHIDKRYTVSGRCHTCHRNLASKDYANNVDRISACSQKSYLKHKSNRTIKSINWHKNNIEKSRAIKRRNKDKHRAKYLVSEKARIKQKRKNDPIWRLSKNTSKAIWESLKKDKRGRHWEECVSYSLYELKSHLETQFDVNMTWENYGSYWHVDHIKPLSKCSSFEEAWQLSNLQPLEKIANLSKGNKYAEDSNGG